MTGHDASLSIINHNYDCCGVHVQCALAKRKAACHWKHKGPMICNLSGWSAGRLVQHESKFPSGGPCAVNAVASLDGNSVLGVLFILLGIT